jgi:hypothetical protein
VPPERYRDASGVRLQPQAITLEEFAEPGCFTTRAHREAVQALLATQA